MSDQPSDLLLAMILLDERQIPDAEQVAERLAARCGDRHRLSWEERSAKDGVAVQFYQLDGRRVNVALMPAPIPWSNLEGPCATNRFWPEAAEVCRAHKAHLIVALRGEWADPVEPHLALTDLIAAMVEAAGARAVYWGAGTVVQPAALFCKWAADSGPDNLPLFLWVDFRLFSRDGGPFVATTGLASFGVMEIEGGSRQMKPIDLVGKVHDIAHYLCTRGPVLKDGDTAGANEVERIRVRHTDSVWERAGKVIRLEFDREPRGIRRLFSGLFGR